MPLLLVLILVLIAFGLLLVGFLTSSVLWAWVSVLVSAAAAVVLVVDTLQRRSAVRAGDTGGIPTTRAADVDPGVEPPTAVAARPVLPPPPGRPVHADPVTEVIPVVRAPAAPPQARFGAPSEAERTIVMPVVQPSGSRMGPSGAAGGTTPSGDFSSPSVTVSEPDAATNLVPVTGPGLDLVKRDGSGTADPTAPAGDASQQHAAGPATVATPAGTSAGPADPAGPPGSAATSAVDAAPDAPGREGPAGAGGPTAAGEPSRAGSGGVAESATSGSPQEPLQHESVQHESVQHEPVQHEPARQESVQQESAQPEPPPGGGEPPEEPRDEQAAALVARSEDEVLVVDEQPRYHVPGCRALVAAALIPLPAREAVELGFTPCGWCTPDRTVAGRQAAAHS